MYRLSSIVFIYLKNNNTIEAFVYPFPIWLSSPNTALELTIILKYGSSCLGHFLF